VLRRRMDSALLLLARSGNRITNERFLVFFPGNFRAEDLPGQIHEVKRDHDVISGIYSKCKILLGPSLGIETILVSS
jgi:hypothetical protein